MDLYETLRRLRDELSPKENNSAWAERAYCLVQIADQAFTNEENPDSVPEVLLIRGCELNSEELIEIFDCLDLNPTRIVLNVGGIPGRFDYEIFFN